MACRGHGIRTFCIVLALMQSCLGQLINNKNVLVVETQDSFLFNNRSLDVTVVQPDTVSTDLVIAVHGASPRLAQEWRIVATVLAQAGYRVALPNFHSHPETAPSGGTAQAVMQAITKLARTYGLEGHSRFVLMGKSWGGKLALQYATTNPTAIDALVLVCAAERNASSYALTAAAGVPMQLLWAKDDSVIPVKVAMEVQDAAPDAALHVVDAGGHSILPQYGPAILAFLKSASRSSLLMQDMQSDQ